MPVSNEEFTRLCASVRHIEALLETICENITKLPEVVAVENILKEDEAIRIRNNGYRVSDFYSVVTPKKS